MLTRQPVGDTGRNETGVRLDRIQALRAIAAMGVVLYHAQHRVHGLWPEAASHLTEYNTNVGQAGVDLFFVLSGFLMAWLHRRQFGREGAAPAFLVRRIVRIVPIYWLLSAVALAIAVYFPRMISSTRLIEWPWLLGSFLFVPWPQSNGSIDRLIIVGWTLDYEMLFYALFAAAMLWRRGLPVLCGAMLSAVVIGGFWRPAHPTLQWLTNAMLLEFLAGVGVAWLYTRYSAPRVIAALVCVAGLSSFVGLQAVAYRPLRWGLPASLIVLGTLWLGLRCRSWFGRLLVTVGDASYSIYLTQVFSLPGVAACLKVTGVESGGDWLTAVLWLCVCLAGVVFWWSVERPITRRVKKSVTEPASQTVDVAQLSA